MHKLTFSFLVFLGILSVGCNQEFTRESATKVYIESLEHLAHEAKAPQVNNALIFAKEKGKIEGPIYPQNQEFYLAAQTFWDSKNFLDDGSSCVISTQDPQKPESCIYPFLQAKLESPYLYSSLVRGLIFFHVLNHVKFFQKKSRSGIFEKQVHAYSMGRLLRLRLGGDKYKNIVRRYSKNFLKNPYLFLDVENTTIYKMLFYGNKDHLGIFDYLGPSVSNRDFSARKFLFRMDVAITIAINLGGKEGKSFLLGYLVSQKL